MASRRGLRSPGLGCVWPPLRFGLRVSPPNCIDLPVVGSPRIARPSVFSSAPSPGLAVLPAVLELKLRAATGKIYSVPEGFVDNEFLTELGLPIMDAPILDVSKLTLQCTCRPRRCVSALDLEKLPREGPTRANMPRLMKLRACKSGRADAAVGIMMASGRYAIPPHWSAIARSYTGSATRRAWSLHRRCCSGASGYGRGVDLPNGDAT